MAVMINVSPHPGQLEVHNDPHRFKVLAAGRRWGKTRLGVLECIDKASAGGIAWWVAPSYKTSEAGWRPLTQICELIPATKVYRGDKMITFASGGLVAVRSSEITSNLRGEGLDLVVMDECAFQRAEVWTEVLRPALADKKGGALFISTPKRCNWFYDLFNKQSLEPETWKSWQFPTASNPFIDPYEIALAKASTAEEVFRQEYLAEFIQEDGSVFRNVEASAVLQPGQARKDHHYVAAADIATATDFTVISVIDLDTKEQVYLSRFNRVDYPVLEARIKQVYQDWFLNMILIEVNGIGKPVMDHLTEQGLNVMPFVTSQGAKANIILGLKAALEHRQLKLLADEVQKRELLNYEERVSANGAFSYSAPAGQHDDCVMALAMAWDMCNKMGGGEEVVIEAGDPLEDIGRFSRRGI